MDWFSPTFLLHAIMAGGCRHSQSAKCRSPQFHVGLFICYFEHSTWVCVTVIVILWTVCVLHDCVCNQITIEDCLLFTGADCLCPVTLQTNFMEHSSSWVADSSSPGQITWKFMSIFTIACHWTLSWTRRIQFIFSHFFWKYVTVVLISTARFPTFFF